MEWQAGAVAWYTRQVPFLLEGGVIYRADFLVVRPLWTGNSDFNVLRPHGYIDVIDCKGAMTQTSYNKLKQVRARYGFEVLIDRGKGWPVPFSQIKVTRRRSSV